jgi:cell cycle checkpoint control protein RAD9A
VNSSRSAFASYTFQRGFFIPDGFGDATNDSSPDDNNIRCKITAKSCLTAFKSLNSLEKTVLKCKVSIDLDASRFIFQFYYHHGTPISDFVCKFIITSNIVNMS